MKRAFISSSCAAARIPIESLVRTVAAVSLSRVTAHLAPLSRGRRCFEEERPGTPPARFELAAMPPGSAEVGSQTGRGNGVLCHEADPRTPAASRMAIAQGEPLEDVVVSARMRFGAGAHAGGGLIWRYTDPGHYFAVDPRSQPSELVLYRVVDGNRIRIESERGLELDVSAWHTLKIVHEDITRVGARSAGSACSRTRAGGRIGRSAPAATAWLRRATRRCGSTICALSSR